MGDWFLLPLDIMIHLLEDRVTDNKNSFKGQLFFGGEKKL